MGGAAARRRRLLAADATLQSACGAEATLALSPARHDALLPVLLVPGSQGPSGRGGQRSEPQPPAPSCTRSRHAVMQPSPRCALFAAGALGSCSVEGGGRGQRGHRAAADVSSVWRT